MSTPPEQKKLWDKIDWSSGEEKLAFFNRYFKNSSMVRDRVDKLNDAFKQRIVDYIKNDEVQLKDNKTRPINNQDIIKELQRK